MSLSGYTVEVTNLSPNATERDLYDFFSFSGAIEHIEIIRTGEYASTAYVTFRDPHALETAVLLSMPEVNHLNTTPREAVTMTQEVVKTMLAMGYELSKDALIKAKAFDESHHVTATAAAMVADLSNRSGLTDKINAGLNAVTSVDERYHLSATTKAVVSATTRTAANITNSVVSSSYFSAGALLVSDALNKAAKVAADLATHGAKR
ncbi:binding partner of ACD11 1-like isoform X2 [Musa acuminata AAA Group]|uniref:RRM domain-containing protein n=1 Tax=Musa acuminata subsp. malaccensis TaxID=214687 RepID=A0A804IEF1_MUSAM|nr:PREDICTED: binding partner of ACD11 1 isoform X2 [Musa acuminata subsp. malaccensis]